MKNKSRYIQLFYLRENWHNRTIRWLRSYGQELNYISIPIDEPNTLMILGFGSFFTPIIRENYATCLCITTRELLAPFFKKRCSDLDFPRDEGKDMLELAKYLRQGDA